MKAKNILKLTVISTTIMFVGMAQIYAATTNLVQNINIALTCYEQGPTNQPAADITTVAVNKFRVTTKDIIAEIGMTTSNNFSGMAHLVLVRNTVSSNSVSSVEIRDGTNSPVDVSSFFSIGQGFGVHSSYFNSVTGTGSSVRYSNLHVMLTNSTLTASLNLRGFAITTRVSFKCYDNVIRVDTVNADVAGTSVDTNGIPGVVNGLVAISGNTIKIE